MTFLKLFFRRSTCAIFTSSMFSIYSEGHSLLCGYVRNVCDVLGVAEGDGGTIGKGVCEDTWQSRSELGGEKRGMEGGCVEVEVMWVVRVGLPRAGGRGKRKGRCDVLR